MLAGKRVVKLNGKPICNTPLLVPSFSSKGFAKEVKGILQTMSEFITDCSLVSAYDIYHGFYGPVDSNFSEVVFLDSGGYEAAKDYELSELKNSISESYAPKEWSQKNCEDIRDRWLKELNGVPTALISFDHPKHRCPVEEQIRNAKSFHGTLPVIKEFLVKPETTTQSLLQIDSIIRNINEISTFDILGLTEKELGNTVIERMANIAIIRKSLKSVGSDIPIHIFGSLDTLLTPLYFISGADIFDGLTWLRYTFHEGSTSYIHHANPLAGHLKKNHLHKVLVDNFYYLESMRDEFGRFVASEGNFQSFKYHTALLEKSYQSLISELGD